MKFQKRAYRRLPALIALLVFATVAMGAIALHFVQNRLVTASGESLALAAADIADKLDLILYERYGDIKILAQAPIFRGRDAAAKTTFLRTMLKAYRYYLWLGATDANGRIVAATDSASLGKDRSNAQWFKTVRDRGGIDVQDVQTFEETGKALAVAFTAPITGPHGEFLGAVTTRVGLPVLEDVIGSTVRALEMQRGASAKIEYQFLTRDGDVVADSILHQEAGKYPVNLKQMALLSALLSASAQPGYVEEMHMRRHVPVVSGYASTEGYGQFTGLHWGVLVRMDRQDILAPINRILGILAVGSAVILVPVLGLLVWMTGRLRREWAMAQRLASLLEESLNEIYVFDAETLKFLTVNKGARMNLGYTMDELLALTPLDLKPEYAPESFAALTRPLRTGEQRLIQFTTIHRRKNGSTYPVEVNLQLFSAASPPVFVAIILDITERKLAEAERNLLHKRLQESHDQLRVLARRLLEVQEEERRLLARELHDEIGQQMTAIKLNLQLLQTSADPARAATRFKDSVGIVDHLLTLVRARSLNLRPPLLDELGLGPALESFVRIQTRRAGLALDLAIEPNAPRLPAPLEIAAFRVVQESLTNVIRHAQATRVAVAMQHTRESVALTVRDDGRGFDMQAMQVRAKAGEHAGLMGLRERVNLFNGDFAIESAPGRGTEVRVTFPLEPAP
jgi:PAS domain S-box-containing protein